MANDLGKLIGAAIMVNFANKAAANDEHKPLILLGSLLLGGWLGGQIQEGFAEPHDTVNYTLFYKGKRVYEGICYDDRKSARLIEHKCNGKKFTTWSFSCPKARSLAIETERRRILKYRPLYNIHHNCD